MLDLEGDGTEGLSWVAVAEDGPEDWHETGYHTTHGRGDTPAAALRDLARALTQPPAGNG